MPRDFEDIDDLDTLTDEELALVARERLEDYPDLALDRIEVDASDGRLAVRGRVGTESDLQRIERVLTDVLGADRVRNELVVDELVRGQRAEEADAAAAERGATGARQGGANQTSDEAAHLREDEAAEMFGTRDTREAIERGYSYEPPDGPIQEGTESREQH